MGNHGGAGRGRRVGLVAAALLGLTVACRPAGATTYVSAEPIPSEAIVGQAKLHKIEALGYANMATWAQLLEDDCQIVGNVIGTLAAAGATSTITPANTRYVVAAGGYQGVTDPSYVLTIDDQGTGAASAADIFVLDNALGYALNQGGTAQFGLAYNPDDANEFPLAYAVVTIGGSLTGEQAQAFFNHLGTIDRALWTGADAGFTQIGLPHAAQNDSMLFLIGNVSTVRFTTGLYQAAQTTPGATYAPFRKNGKPGFATAGAAFPGNGWATKSGGYLENLPALPGLAKDLEALRQRHLRAVADLMEAIRQGDVATYLGAGFACPE